MVRGSIEVRARVRGAPIEIVTLSIDQGKPIEMQALDACTWGVFWNSEQRADDSNLLAVNARCGAWPEKHILGTQLGPHENGDPWPPRRERAGVTQ